VKLPKTQETLYQEAFWTQFIGLSVGIGMMMLGTSIYVLPLITVGMLLLVATLPLSYYMLTRAERYTEP
jgi:4-amino-4-deoxy-L-arabinose transferase-like glycosyltransferase